MTGRECLQERRRWITSCNGSGFRSHSLRTAATTSSIRLSQPGFVVDAMLDVQLAMPSCGMRYGAGAGQSLQQPLAHVLVSIRCCISARISSSEQCLFFSVPDKLSGLARLRNEQRLARFIAQICPEPVTESRTKVMTPLDQSMARSVAAFL